LHHEDSAADVHRNDGAAQAWQGRSTLSTLTVVLVVLGIVFDDSRHTIQEEAR